MCYTACIKHDHDPHNVLWSCKLEELHIMMMETKTEEKR